MPINASRGGASSKGFGFTGGVFKFLEATGGTVTTSGNFKIHTFTAGSNFVVTQAYTDPTVYPVQVLIVAGGGGGGDGGGNGGAGGGGGYLEGTFTNFTTGSYPVVIGGGGSTSAGTNTHGQDGSPSTFKGATANGGGGGGGTGAEQGRAGGSGGGGGRNSQPGGSSNQSPSAGLTAYGNSGGTGLENLNSDPI